MEAVLRLSVEERERNTVGRLHTNPTKTTLNPISICKGAEKKYLREQIGFNSLDILKTLALLFQCDIVLAFSSVHVVSQI